MSNDDSIQSSGRLRRWAQMKSEEFDQPSLPEPVIADGVCQAEPVVLCDDDMPNLATLDEYSDYSSFLSEGVSKGLRKVALQQLFRASKFNVVDGLDDYAEDFTQFEPLGDIVTADMKHSIERAKQALADLIEDEPATDQAAVEKPLAVDDHSEEPEADDS